jgi:hypothetical protein
MPIAATCAWHSITRDPPGFEFLPCVVLLMLDWRLVMNMLSLRSIIRFDRVPDQRLAYKTCLQLRNAVLLRRGGASARRHLKNLIVFALHHTDMCRAHQFHPLTSCLYTLCQVDTKTLFSSQSLKFDDRHIASKASIVRSIGELSVSRRVFQLWEDYFNFQHGR